MRYRRRKVQRNSLLNNGELWVNLLKMVVEVLLANKNPKNNQQTGRGTTNVGVSPTNGKVSVDNNQNSNTDSSSSGGTEPSQEQRANTPLNNGQRVTTRRPNRTLNEYEQVLAGTNKKTMAELIRELYHGITVNITLTNGQNIDGEVIGLYNNILILRSAGIINYIKGESIVRFS